MESFKNLAEAEIFHRQKEKKNDGLYPIVIDDGCLIQEREYISLIAASGSEVDSNGHIIIFIQIKARANSFIRINQSITSPELRLELTKSLKEIHQL
uniref:Uncharacterized protein n=1 Tax=Schistosoma haematobium TaxID=6185 RepID=A0A094ZVC5_SCHHA